MPAFSRSTTIVNIGHLPGHTQGKEALLREHGFTNVTSVLCESTPVDDVKRMLKAAATPEGALFLVGGAMMKGAHWARRGWGVGEHGGGVGEHGCSTERRGVGRGRTWLHGVSVERWGWLLCVARNTTTCDAERALPAHPRRCSVLTTPTRRSSSGFPALMAELLDFVASECPTILVHKTSAPDFDAEVAFPPGPTEAQVNKSALNIASRYLSEGKTW